MNHKSSSALQVKVTLTGIDNFEEWDDALKACLRVNRLYFVLFPEELAGFEAPQVPQPLDVGEKEDILSTPTKLSREEISKLSEEDFDKWQQTLIKG